MYVSSGIRVSSNTTLPLGNVTLVVSVEDSLGASSTTDAVVEVFFSSGDVVSVVSNATHEIADLIAAGDDASAVAMIATCAEMLGSTVGESGVTEVRSHLLSLAWNTTLAVSTEAVALQAATLELILAAPEDIDETTAASAIQYAGTVANSSRSLGSLSSDTRGSLVRLLSLTIDAGALSADAATTAGQRLTGDGPAVGSAVSRLLVVVKPPHYDAERHL